MAQPLASEDLDWDRLKRLQELGRERGQVIEVLLEQGIVCTKDAQGNILVSSPLADFLKTP